jgi:putative metallohydrolase (TIGR04338 family)
MATRDNQRAKFYRALPGMDDLLFNKKFGTEQEAKTFLAQVVNQEWFQSMFGPTRIEFALGGSVGGALHYTNRGNLCTVRIRRWTFRPAILLRILAHALIDMEFAYHGPEFCAIYLYLLKRVMGDAVCAHFVKKFVQNKVNFRPNPEMDSVDGQMVLYKLNNRKF